MLNNINTTQLIKAFQIKRKIKIPPYKFFPIKNS